jgi:RNA 2',3'-cyclic 3'-phosphodiesterase
MSDRSQMPSHRLFIAVATPETVRGEIAKAQNELRQALPEGAVRWTRAEHFHLTLRFLGNVGVERIDALKEKLRIACHDFAPMKVRAERIGFFPERGFPRVIWVSVCDKDRQLAQLHGGIQTSTHEFTSEPAENEFAAHITLGRAEKIGRREADTLGGFATRMHPSSFGEWTVDGVELFRSELRPDGAHHTVLAKIPLGGTV